MMKLEAIIQPNRFEAVKGALVALGINGMTVSDDKLVDSIIDAIAKTAATGKIGDGKIFLSKIDDVVRIRNMERGATAL